MKHFLFEIKILVRLAILALIVIYHHEHFYTALHKAIMKNFSTF